MNIQQRLRVEYEPDVFMTSDEPLSIRSLTEESDEDIIYRVIYHPTTRTKREKENAEQAKKAAKKQAEYEQHLKDYRPLNVDESIDMRNKLLRIVDFAINKLIGDIAEEYGYLDAVEELVKITISKIYTMWKNIPLLSKDKDHFEKLIADVSYVNCMCQHLTLSILRQIAFKSIPYEICNTSEGIAIVRSYHIFELYSNKDRFNISKDDPFMERLSRGTSHFEVTDIEFLAHTVFSLDDSIIASRYRKVFEPARIAYSKLIMKVNDYTRGVLYRKNRYAESKQKVEDIDKRVALLKEFIAKNTNLSNELIMHHRAIAGSSRNISSWMRYADPECASYMEFLHRDENQKTMYNAYRKFIYDLEPGVNPGKLFDGTEYRTARIKINNASAKTRKDRMEMYLSTIGPLCATIESLMMWFWTYIMWIHDFTSRNDISKYGLTIENVKKYVAPFLFGYTEKQIELEMVRKMCSLTNVSEISKRCASLNEKAMKWLEDGSGFTVYTIIYNYGNSFEEDRYSKFIDIPGSDTRAWASDWCIQSVFDDWCDDATKEDYEQHRKCHRTIEMDKHEMRELESKRGPIVAFIHNYENNKFDNRREDDITVEFNDLQRKYNNYQEYIKENGEAPIHYEVLDKIKELLSKTPDEIKADALKKKLEKEDGDNETVGS